jgi:hypothetical protein
MVLDSDLLSKGLARDLIRRVQAKRKQLDLEVEATIQLSVWIDGMELADDDWEHVKSETRAGRALLNEGKSPTDTETFEIDRTNVTFYLS